MPVLSRQGLGAFTCRYTLPSLRLMLLPQLGGVTQVPPEKDYVVGEITVATENGRDTIRYGGMIAEFVQIKLVGLAHNINKNNVKGVSGGLAVATNSS